jgi:hypothetical protein
MLKAARVCVPLLRFRAIATASAAALALGLLGAAGDVAASIKPAQSPAATVEQAQRGRMAARR